MENKNKDDQKQIDPASINSEENKNEQEQKQFDLASINIEENKKQLQTIIDANNKSANYSLGLGVILILAGLAFFAIAACCKPGNLNVGNNGFVIWLTQDAGRLVISALVEIAGITLLMAYKGNMKQANDYRTELIALRDLDIAIAICNKTSPADEDRTVTNDGTNTITKLKSQKSKMQQSIIEALLNRYD